MDEIRDGDNALSRAENHYNNEDVDAEEIKQRNSCDRVDVTSCATTSTTSTNVATTECKSSSTAQNLHANLWNKFLKTITQQHETARKYPNPDVPEFYPRNTTGYFNACTNSLNHQINTTMATGTTMSSTSNCIAYNTNIIPKNDLVLMSQQCFAAATTTTTVTDMNLKSIVDPNRDLVHGVAHYYWTFRDPNHYHIPRVITYKSDQLQIATTPVDGLVKPTSSEPAVFQNELGKKDKQLVHLNNVVKALLEEIWRVNELLMKHKNKEQLKNDLAFAIDELLKPSSELGFHCDDCCDKFKHFVIKIFKQQERKMAKQQTHYKDMFIDYLVSVIENSLETFGKCGQVKYNFKTALTKHDAATQTDHFSQNDQRKPYRRPDTRKSKQQMTKIYRNRNFYKASDVVHNNATLDPPNWYPAAMPTTSYTTNQNQNDKHKNKLIKNFHPNAYAYSYSAVPAQEPSFYESHTSNPIQLIHQKYKNLNCRLEGIPDKNLVKFSYIVNGKEYSAIATTKKEAQYHCAWHVLGATKQK